MRDGYRICVATDRDAGLLEHVGTQTFIEAFSDLYSEKDLQQFLREDHSVDWYAQHLADPMYRIWLALTPDGEAVGYALGGKCTLPVETPPKKAGEIKRIYVLPEHQSAGLGAKMMDAMLSWFKEESFSPLYVGVYSENHGARRLYERYGFSRVGEHKFRVGNQEDVDFILRRE